jgi:dTMP kinase
MRGKFIVFEGADGSGKTTAIQHVMTKMDESAIPYRLTREPGGTQAGETVRHLLLTPNMGEITPKMELLLFSAARTNHCELIIAPAILNGTTVICDRFDYSTIAYQLAGRGRLEYETAFQQITEFARGGVNPDLVVLLDIDTDEALRRMNQRPEEKNRLDREAETFHASVRKSYLDQMQRDSRSKWAKINANLSKEEVGDACWQAVAKCLGIPSD